MMTTADFRRIALSLEEVEEYSHAGLPAFRVEGRKFASLASQAGGYGNLMLTLEQQASFVEEAPGIFLPIPGGWGKMGHTHIRLAVASEDVLTLEVFVRALTRLLSDPERLVRMAVTEINKQLPGELVVSGSDLSLFQNFPYISIGLKNVKLLPGKTTGLKPIYEAERMFVGFSIKDILNQQYHVKVILLKNGHLDLIQDSTGQLNIVDVVPGE